MAAHASAYRVRRSATDKCPVFGLPRILEFFLERRGQPPAPALSSLFWEAAIDAYCGAERRRQFEARNRESVVR
jgi:hypothetical protein